METGRRIFIVMHAEAYEPPEFIAVEVSEDSAVGKAEAWISERSEIRRRDIEIDEWEIGGACLRSITLEDLVA